MSIRQSFPCFRSRLFWLHSPRNSVPVGSRLGAFSWQGAIQMSRFAEILLVGWGRDSSLQFLQIISTRTTGPRSERHTGGRPFFPPRLLRTFLCGGTLNPGFGNRRSSKPERSARKSFEPSKHRGNQFTPDVHLHSLLRISWACKTSSLGPTGALTVSHSHCAPRKHKIALKMESKTEIPYSMSYHAIP